MRNPSNNDRLNYLLNAYIKNTCSQQEMEELFLLIEQLNDEQLLPVLEALWAKAREKDMADLVNWDKMYSTMSAKFHSLETRSPVTRRRRVKRYWAIASILFLAGVGLTLFMPRSSRPARHKPAPTALRRDVQPGGNKALLTLSDGSSIVLDSAGNGLLSTQGNAKVIKLDCGRLSYQTEGRQQTDQPLVFNTISTPKGGQYEVVLPDGTTVWLDAASSIRFPTAFNDSERKVELTGEAYFEVTANPRKPFIVSVKLPQKDRELQKIAVLGTRFNVMAYAEENEVQTTLVDGAVQVSADAKGSARLKPGQQAQTNSRDLSPIHIVEDANVEAAVAWKNGYFDFNRADIHTIMRQLSRWYDINVVYQGEGPGREFYGGIQRNLPLSAVCSILEKSGVKFSIENRTLTVNL